MERQRAYDEQLATVTKKEEKLATFLDLPPDPTAAKKVFEAKMQSLLSARKQLEDGLSFL